MKLPQYLNEKTQVYKGRLLSLYKPSFTSSRGITYDRDILVHPGASVILPFLDNERIIFVRNYRVAVDETLLELPAGTLEVNEDPQLTAQRELEEETGYQCSSIKLLMTFYTSPGFSNEKMHGYLASDLNYVDQKLEENEKIDVEILKFDEALEAVKTGRIQDAKTIALLLYAKVFVTI